MHYVGCDLHKRTTWFYVVDEIGQKIDSRNINNDAVELKEYLQEIPQPFILAVEATYNWYFFVDLAEQYAQEVSLANSYELKAFAKRHKKNDKIDARLIADVLCKGYLPKVTIADQQTRQMRELLRSRMTLVGDRTRSITRLKALLDKLGDSTPRALTTLKGLESINNSRMPKVYAQIVDDYKDRISYLIKKIQEANKNILEGAQSNGDIKNLETIPGFGYFSAALIQSEIIDIDRFKSFNRLCAYAGLAPRVSSSAEKIFHGPINKNRRKHLQWILLENVYRFIKCVPDKEEKFLKLKKRCGHNTAKVILARDLLKIVYHVLRERRSFYWAKEAIRENTEEARYDEGEVVGAESPS
jgi:transposase